MDYNDIFALDNYDDNPLDAIGVNTIPTQKSATYAPSAEGELVTDAFDTFMSNGDNYAYPQVSGVAGEEPMVLVFGEGFISPEPQPEPPSGKICMYLEAAQANSTVGMVSNLETAPELEYSTDGVTWQEWQHTTVNGEHDFDTITLGAVGDRVYFRGDNPNGLGYVDEDEDIWQSSAFYLTGLINAGGNVMSLLDKTMTLTEVPSAGLLELFYNDQADPALLTPPLMDTITTIGESGCNSTYYGCASLTSAADMPALTTIGDGGCEYMYSNCTFAMSDDGETLNFAFQTPPVTAGETTYKTAYEIAVWMDNTNGF